MKDYVKHHFVEISLELLSILYQENRLEKMVDHYLNSVHADMITAKKENRQILDLLYRIEARAAKELQQEKESVIFYFQPLHHEETEYESMISNLLLSSVISSRDYCDLTSYIQAFHDMSETDYFEGFGKMILAYNATNYKIIESADMPLNTSMSIIAYIMKMDLPQDVKWTIQDIFVNHREHLKNVFALMTHTIDILADYETELEEISQNFYNYWNEKMQKVNMPDFIKQNFHMSGYLENSLGYMLYPSFFIPYEIGFSVSQDDDTGHYNSPYIFTFGILFGEHLQPILPSNIDFEEDEDKYIEALKQLSDKSRFEIMSYISKKPAYGGELAKHLGLTTATVSHHVAQLLSAALITAEKTDSRMYYSPNRNTLEKCLAFYRRKLL